jgi:hypothetical protein
MVVPFLIFKDVLVYLLIYLHSRGTLHALSLDSSPVFARRRRILAIHLDHQYNHNNQLIFCNIIYHLMKSSYAILYETSNLVLQNLLIYAFIVHKFWK